MEESLYELLLPHLKAGAVDRSIPKLRDDTTSKYLGRLTTLQLDAFQEDEGRSLARSSHSNLLSIQSLSTRSSKVIIDSADRLSNLRPNISELAKGVRAFKNGISGLDGRVVGFSEKYSRSGENAVLDRRKRALMMSRNVDRLSDVMDLPTLLSSAISSSLTRGALSSTGYNAALDLSSHIKQLHGLYPESEMIGCISEQGESAMREMTSNLITGLRGQNVKLAAGMRTIGYLRRIAPELSSGPSASTAVYGEGSLGALFLVCRLANLGSMLDALQPLRELADQETQARTVGDGGPATKPNLWASGQQTERYLKRYIEIFREQSFAIISTFKSIFPSEEASNSEDLDAQFKSLGLKSSLPDRSSTDKKDPLQPLPSALTSFPLHLVDLLTETLDRYMPNVRDRASRESLFTQVLYCAGSLGRLGADFSIVLASLHDGSEEGEREEEEEEEEDDEDDNDNSVVEWVSVMKKHRVLSGRLEQLASSAGQAKSTARGIDAAASKLK